jgi:hypothetical protein
MILTRRDVLQRACGVLAAAAIPAKAATGAAAVSEVTSKASYRSLIDRRSWGRGRIRRERWAACKLPLKYWRARADYRHAGKETGIQPSCWKFWNTL